MERQIEALRVLVLVVEGREKLPEQRHEIQEREQPQAGHRPAIFPQFAPRELGGRLRSAHQFARGASCQGLARGLGVGDVLRRERGRSRQLPLTPKRRAIRATRIQENAVQS